MAHEDCKHEWDSRLTRKLPEPPDSMKPDGTIKIHEVGGKLKGSHDDSTSTFEVTCSGNKTRISFTRDDNKNKKRIHYEGKFTSPNSIHGTYTRTDIATLSSGKSAKRALSGDSGDWDATKPPTRLKRQAPAAQGDAKSAKKRSGTAAKKSSKKQARKKA